MSRFIDGVEKAGKGFIKGVHIVVNSPEDADWPPNHEGPSDRRESEPPRIDHGIGIITENTNTRVVNGENLDANGNKIGAINQYYLDSGHYDAQSFYNYQLINGFSVKDFDRLNELAGASKEQTFALGQEYFAKLWEDGNPDNALTFDEFSSLLKETETVIDDDVFKNF